MKFSCTVEIDLLVEKVTGLFTDADNFRKWQDGFISIEHLSGAAGEPGAKSRLIYKTGRQTIELIETIVTNNLPDEMKGLYEHKHMVNTMTNRFYRLGENKTKYVAEIEYTRFIGFIPVMMALLMPGMFKKQVQKRLAQFKAFAEKSGK
jgi:uncharacterized membrane protein